MANSIIKFVNVSKRFKKGQKLLLKEALLDIFKFQSPDYFWALKDVSFEVMEGETLGIIGKNGSGKSTILKLIAQVMVPSEGEIKVEGKIAPLIELGAGFHPELSGKENIYINGSILGLTQKQIKSRFNKIVEFSELGDFIDTPVKHYSSGMYVRLGFSIAIHTEPRILLIDEILAVGDVAFQAKCYKKLNSFKKKGITIIFISHSLPLVKQFCDKVMLIEEGVIKATGEPTSIIKKYLESNS